MGDDVTLNTMTGGDVIGADEIGGVKYQRVKLIEGANGTNDGDISAANPLPIEGTVTANLSATDNAVLDDIDTAIDAINAKLVTGTVIGDVNLGATDNAVLDTIDAAIDAINAKLVTGTVIGDVNLGATDNAVLDAAVTALQLIDNAVSGSGFNVTQLAGAAVPVGPGVEATAVRVTLPTDGTGKVTAVSGTAANLKVEAALAAAQTLATVTTVATVTALTGGGIAHDAADSGNPVKVGARVDLTPSTATITADNDRSDLIADSDGALLVRSECTLGDCLTESISNTNGTATASAIFTTGAGVRNVIQTIVAYNSSATAGFCLLTDGSGGTTLMCVPLPAGGGAVICLGNVPIRTTANTALYYDVSGALTTVYLTFVGYRSKVA
jgi:hypothetical protein